ncbi:methyl-accepting chemotaxis protein [Romboutsia lituseburensis]|uniref:methyl-accepting chemotaxis protein n=1 Tax=Romboutsia lituseburensis TaxID=1537 RepID=UPI00215A579C|nr:methyl-accepting chemotaxis protein [Romboutsia lituseburensis]MCR8746989.1 methyl-accepting chemotaxis protein [Romboutsia lituseburensis]
MKNWKVGKKLGVAFLILILMSVFAGANSLAKLRKGVKASTSFSEQSNELTVLSMQIKKDIVSVEKNITKGILSTNPVELKSFVNKDLDEMYKKVNTIRNDFKDEETVNQLANNIERSINELKNQSMQVFTLIESGKRQEASEMIASNNGQYATVSSKCLNEAEKLYEYTQGLIKEKNTDLKAKAKRAWIISVAIGISVIAAGVAMCIYIGKILKNPIEELEQCANQMSAGDFDVNIEYTSEDELGKLADSMRLMSEKVNAIIHDTVRILGEVASGNFDVEPEAEYIGVFKNIETSINKIINDLSETMAQINASSEEVQSASEQVANGSQMLSQGSTEQASAIEELSSTIIDISEKINNTAENAKKANALTLNAGRQVRDGNEQMKEMIKAMDEISFTSSEIGRIIKTIDDIAFQTNILALNAAVEAARAGSAGKGFAVVADEVRNLAAKSAEAAKNTSDLIENSIKAVENGNLILENTAQSLNKIVKTANRTSAVVNEITKANEEQATAIAQVRLGVDQISEVVQTSSHAAQESAASSEELSGQAQILKSLMAHFKLKGGNKSLEKFNFEYDDKEFFGLN